MGSTTNSTAGYVSTAPYVRKTYDFKSKKEARAFAKANGLKTFRYTVTYTQPFRGVVTSTTYVVAACKEDVR